MLRQKDDSFGETKRSTFDEMHFSKMLELNALEEETIPMLEEEKKTLQQHLKRILRDDSGYNNSVVDIVDTRHKIKQLDKQIDELKLKKNIYILKNAKYIFSYFEEKQNINKMNPDSLISSKRIYQEYLKNVSNTLFNIDKYCFNFHQCEKCSKGEMIIQEDEGVLICNNKECSRYVNYIVDTYKQNNKEPPNDPTYSVYIRLNHFKEILSQFQAKETTKIPQEVIDAISKRIKKERIVDIKKIDTKKMRSILKTLNYTRYFEHVAYINSLLGIQPPIMDEKLIETLCVLFIETQKPWASYCPPDRTNFFNYNYTLYQLCVLLGQTQYISYINCMKDSSKQKLQDDIWKKVCKELDWVFYPTV
jgi:hypothetical protein